MRAQAAIGGLWLALLFAGCARGVAFHPRTEPACAQDEADPPAQQERSYLALAVALDERRFTILRRSEHSVVEVELPNPAQPLAHTTHWLIWLKPDGALRVGTPPYQPVQHARSQRAYDGLMASYATYRCRQLDWLRWEAQNRGLLAIGNVERSEVEHARDTAASKHAEELAVLRVQRDALRLQDPAARTVSTAILLTLSGVVVAQGGMQAHLCREDLGDDRACLRRAILLPVGGVLAAASATALAFSFRDLMHKLRARRELKHQIEGMSLRGVKLSANHAGAMLECALNF